MDPGDAVYKRSTRDKSVIEMIIDASRDTSQMTVYNSDKEEK